MQNNAALKPIVKYAVPRNKEMPETSLVEVLASESVAGYKDGKVEGSHLPLFEGRAAPLPKSALLRPGKLFLFKIGWLYVFDERQSEAEWYFEAAKMAASLTLLAASQATTGPMSYLVEELWKELLLGGTEESGKAQKSGGAGVPWNAYLKMLSVCLVSC